jgi:hypothetical protein
MPDTFAPLDIDWRNPDYTSIFLRRARALRALREDLKQNGPAQLTAVKSYYREHISDFISDWGTTYDPRNVEIGLPVLLPFILYPKQRAWVDWALDHWRRQRSGVTDKSRDVGMSWLAVATANALCLFYQGMSIGFGSYLKDYVDQTGEPKAIFVKLRLFRENLPAELNGAYDAENDAPYMRMFFRETQSQIGGQVGDEIGRGDRRGIYLIDESAHLQHPDKVDAALAMTTNCRIDFSSANGMANSFARRRFSLPAEDVFTFHWRDDPRKDDDWYQRKVHELNNPVIVAQELDINYQASVEGILIPSDWVQASIGACAKLGFFPTGKATGALDVADEGADTNAFCGALGVEVRHLEEWSGKGSDIFGTVERAFRLCDQHQLSGFRADADGLGAGVRGDARVINERRMTTGPSILDIEAFQGSEGVFEPRSQDVDGRFNEDMFKNRKAQSWWHLRTLFSNAYRAVVEHDQTIDRDEIISLDPRLPLLDKLCIELSQPTYSHDTAGKMLVNKQPEGAKSPNLADAVMIRFARVQQAVYISDSLLAWSRQRG